MVSGTTEHCGEVGSASYKRHQTYKSLGFETIDVTKPDTVKGFGAIDVTKPYKSTGFGAMDVTKPY